jgi:hypothetical protein
MKRCSGFVAGARDGLPDGNVSYDTMNGVGGALTKMDGMSSGQAGRSFT